AAAVVLRRPVVFGLALALVAGGRAHAATVALSVPPPARISGVAQLVSDPERGDFGTRVMVRADGRRWLAEVPRDLEASIGRRLMGDRVELVGRPGPLTGAPRGWVLSRHLAGRLTVQSIGDAAPTVWWYAVANEVHRRLDLGSRSFGDERRPLFLGLVLGDDRDQSDLMSFRFRASGLGHLLAVSGQNVAFLMAVAAPLLTRVRIRWRWMAVAALLALFVLTTRAEPSVLRAAAMAGTAAVATSMGRIASGTRVIGLAVIGLLVADPLLVHSTGFQLSVAASASLLVLTRPIARRLPGPGWLCEPLSVSLAAQIGTAPLLLGLSGALPPASVMANLLAVPAAGMVMMLGLTTGLVAGFLRDDLAAVVQVPSRALVWWIDVVATAAAGVPLRPLAPFSIAILAVTATATWLLHCWWRRRRIDGSAASRRATTAAAIVGATAAVVVVAATLAPPSWATGRHALGPGVALVIDPCGGRTVEVANRVRVRDALDGVWLAGLFRAERVVTRERNTAAAQAVAIHLDAEVVTTSDPPAADPTRCHRPPRDRPP
ncbi:MAG: ComEC/Rec2 family competence protein, partial [Acidimicrobiales bacterium]